MQFENMRINKYKSNRPKVKKTIQNIWNKIVLYTNSLVASALPSESDKLHSSSSYSKFRRVHGQISISQLVIELFLGLYINY